jgi:Transglycosylase SLT domain
MTDPSTPLLSLPAAATATVVSDIRQASSATKVDFGLLMAEAQQESGFRADAKASGSSATGLFQFISNSWLGLVQRFGEKYGIGALARQIGTDSAGRLVVPDAMARQRILDLRKDPKLSAALAAEQTRLNEDSLEAALGRAPSSAELYLAHFLGATGAVTFIKSAALGDSTAAADLMPEAAAANRGVFFDASGRARSLGEIYQAFSDRIDGEAQRFSTLRGGGPSTGDAPAYARSLGFSAPRIDPPVAAMLALFALTAQRQPPTHPQRRSI